MKSKRSILAVSLSLLLSLWANNQVYSCSGPWYQPAGYSMYRVCADNDYLIEPSLEILPEYNQDAMKNCQLWQALTSIEIPLEAIHEVVYEYSSQDMQAMRNDVDSLYAGNKFAKWIMTHRDWEISDLLYLAKACEEIRCEQNSPWYYPTKSDGVKATLIDIANQAKAYNGHRLRDRYALQTVRALFASAQYDACINYWEGIQKSVPNGLIRKMTVPYIAGAYFRVGIKDRAMQLFASCGDIESLLYCSGKQGKQLDDVELFKLVYPYCPDSPSFAPMLQKIIRQGEPIGDRWGDEPPVAGKYAHLRKFALEVARQGKVKDAAMWYYTAAFISHLDNKPQEASAVLQQAENAPGSKLVKESIRVFRIYLDAKLQAYGPAYEKRLFGELRWLDQKIKNNLNPHIKFNTSKSDSYYLQISQSYYYWNDMMRKILLAEVCPRMVRHGSYTRAIQLANMADNRMLNIVDTLADWDGTNRVSLAEYRHRRGRFNWLDYSNNLFTLVDTVGVDHLIAYKKGLNSPAQSAFDQFLNTRGYTDPDFFNDLIGTQCLREMRYKEAVNYLAQVPAAFQYQLNTYQDNGMWADPFSITPTSIEDKSDYKYNFAREMYSLEQAINRTPDPNRKAQLMLRFGTGLRNSFAESWALTQYYVGAKRIHGLRSGPKYWREITDKRSKELYAAAFKLFTDRECAAQAHLLFFYRRTVLEKYPETLAATEIRGACDCYADYSAE